MELVYYKRNVPFPLVARENLRDNIGVLLTDGNPIIAIEKSKIRDFIIANKLSLQEGKLIEIPEPPLETISPNAITDEEAVVLVNNYYNLKKKLSEVTSETAALKLLETAKSERRPIKTIELIQSRLEELTPVSMQGVLDSKE